MRAERVAPNVFYRTVTRNAPGYAFPSQESIPEVAAMENSDRVRAATSESVNRQIDRSAMDRLRRHERESKLDLTCRMRELDREWDVERVLQTNASALALTGIVLGVTRSKNWLLLPAVVLSFLMQHAVQGWCPPVPVIRRLGIRTRKEIDQEKYALKAMRGDFAGKGSSSSAESAMRSVRA